MARTKKRRKTSGTGRKHTKRLAAGEQEGLESLAGQLAAFRDSLIERRADLQREIAGLGQALEALGKTDRAATVRVARQPAAKLRLPSVRSGSLKSYILKVFSPGKEMTVKEVGLAVKRAGYRTKSDNFPNQVSNAMAQIPELTKLARGRYRH